MLYLNSLNASYKLSRVAEKTSKNRNSLRFFISTFSSILSAGSLKYSSSSPLLPPLDLTVEGFYILIFDNFNMLPLFESSSLVTRVSNTTGQQPNLMRISFRVTLSSFI